MNYGMIGDINEVGRWRLNEVLVWTVVLVFIRRLFSHQLAWVINVIMQHQHDTLKGIFMFGMVMHVLQHAHAAIREPSTNFLTMSMVVQFCSMVTHPKYDVALSFSLFDMPTQITRPTHQDRKSVV